MLFADIHVGAAQAGLALIGEILTTSLPNMPSEHRFSEF
jgi:hypothetical protein